MEVSDAVEPLAPRGPSRTVSWIVVAAAVAIIVGLHVAGADDTEAGDDRAALVVVGLQGRLLTGAAQVAPEPARRALDELDQIATTPTLADAVAALRAGLADPGSAADARALELLDAHRPPAGDPAAVALHDAVRVAIADPERLDPAGRERIRAALGFPGRLLLARGAPAGDPRRAGVIADAMRTLFAIAALLLAAGAGIVAGIALLGVALWRFNAGALRARFVPPPKHGAVYLRAFAVYLAGFVVLVIGPALVGIDLPGIGIAGLVVASVLGASWPFLRGVPAAEARRELGLDRGSGLLREVGAGIAGYVAMLPLVAVGFGLTLAILTAQQWIHPPSPDQPPQIATHPVLLWLAGGGTAIRVAVLMLAAAFAPLFEELMFRGALYASLRPRLRAALAAATVALVFAAIHPQGLALVPTLGALAFGLAMLREWRSSLVAPMAAHALHNATLVACVWIALS